MCSHGRRYRTARSAVRRFSIAAVSVAVLASTAFGASALTAGASARDRDDSLLDCIARWEMYIACVLTGNPTCKEPDCTLTDTGT